jgi:hypothetical protein
MRCALLCLVWLGCTGARPPATDRLACYGCHQAEYDNAQMGQFPASACSKKPVHDPALGYTTECYTCHGTVAPDPSPDPTVTLSGWCPAVDPVSDPKRHDVFRIATGSHAGFDCGDCHVQRVAGKSLANADIPQPIWCTTCHTHDRAATDAHHLGNGGYSYSETSCLALGCHGGGLRQ